MKDKWGIEVTDEYTFQTAMLKSSQEKGWILYMSEKANVYASREEAGRQSGDQASLR